MCSENFNQVFANLYLCKGVRKAVFNEDNFQEAIACFTNAIKLDPEFKLAYFARGVAKLRSNMTDNGTEDFQSSEKLEKETLNNNQKKCLILLEYFKKQNDKNFKLTTNDKKMIQNTNEELYEYLDTEGRRIISILRNLIF